VKRELSGIMVAEGLHPFHLPLGIELDQSRDGSAITYSPCIAKLGQHTFVAGGATQFVAVRRFDDALWAMLSSRGAQRRGDPGAARTVLAAPGSPRRKRLAMTKTVRANGGWY
jgi:hypothetical protein